MQDLTMPYLGLTPALGASERTLRLFAIEDDPTFARILRLMAESMGASLDIFDPDEDFDRLPRDDEYDAGLVDYDLGNLNGAQVAALYAETPVILISVTDAGAFDAIQWPRSVRAFLSKRRGARALVEHGLRLAKQPTVLC